MAFPLIPEQASTMSAEVDHLLYFLVGVSVFFMVVIFGAIAYFALRYRRRSDTELPGPVHGALPLEIAWSVIPFGLTMVMFAWGASVFFREGKPPRNAMQINVVGKQWMWKLQHMEGPREINELHVPLGKPVKLMMTSEDVIHSFYVPAFRIKQDVLPGRYTMTWFEASKTGTYHLFCAEYCGTSHSGMIGSIIVMEPKDYESWLKGSPSASMVDNGRRLFEELACVNCHKPDSSGRCPSLEGLYGKTVKLADGRTVKADEDYLRQSILAPADKVVNGFEPLMPTFTGQVNEEGVLQLVEYIKSLAGRTASPGTVGAAGNR
jgi:cytochrome c oxidase subunit II